MSFLKKKFFLFFLLGFVFIPLISNSETISGVEISPALDISLFVPYKIKAVVSGSPTSVSVNVSTINGDGTSFWNYFTDGTPNSESVTKAMTYDSGEGKYISENIYPDSIYPEIFFSPSNITWNNAPLNTDIRRANYQIMHFNNPLSVVASSTFFIEINAVPKSVVNSSDLNVYLVRNNKTISFFNSDWRTSPDVELVSTFNKNSVYNHTHNVNSSHNLITLMTNSDGTIGTKNLNISDDFWVVLYSDAPNTAKGWDLKYQPNALCTNASNRWYKASQSGWTTTVESGCPDAHIHMARRESPTIDMVIATTTANYTGGSSISGVQLFSFAPLPNLAPNPTSFISPLAGGVYDGGVEERVLISWDSASDSNNDPLNYSVYLYNGVSTTTLVTATSSTSFDLDISSINDGPYGLQGVICDNYITPACTDFFLESNFSIDKADPIYSLSNINIFSDNSLDDIAKAGDTISLSFTSSGDISSSTSVDLYSGGDLVHGTSSVNHTGNQWSVSCVIQPSDLEGSLDFVISADNLDSIYNTTSDNSFVYVDTVSPASVAASPEPGTFNSSQDVSLSSSGSSYIKYNIDLSSLTCLLGQIYSGPISISTPSTIKALGCDVAGNSSAVSILEYDFVYQVSYRRPIRRTSIISTSTDQILSTSSNILNTSGTTTTIEIYSSSSTTEVYKPIVDSIQTNKFIFMRNLRLKDKGEDVKKLQEFLNKNGFLLAKFGPGSLGLETEYFGILTKNALIKYQERYSLEILKPLRLIKGTGFFGNSTRKYVNSVYR